MSLGCYADDSSQTKTIKHSFAAKNSSLCAFVVAVSVCWRSISLDRATKAPVFYFSSHHYRSSTSQLLLLLQTDSFIVHRKMERPQSNSESGDHQSGNLSQTLWLLGDINTECPCERNCGPECFFQLLKEVTKPRKGPSLLKSRSESVLSDKYYRASAIPIPLSDVGLPKRKPPTRANSYTPNTKKEMFTQSTDGRIESPGRSRHNLNINNLLSNNNTPTTTTSNIQPVPLSPNRHRKSTSWHSQQVTNVNSDVHDPLLAMNAIGASLPAISVLQSGADHVFARVEEAAEGDRQEILSPLKLQKLKLQQRQLLESLNRERSNSSHLRIHKRPKDMGIISEETD